MDRKKDYYYRKAKKEDYRSRAAYKLIQLDERFSLFRAGDTVIELGASPGGWSQVAIEKVGSEGRVIAIDLKIIEPIEGVVCIKGDARSEITRGKVKDLLQDKKADIILSDMAPNISGNYSTDHARSIELATMTIEYSDAFLNKGGNMAVKIFDGDMALDFFKLIEDKFWSAKRYSPKASRKTSSEIYMVGKSKK